MEQEGCGGGVGCTIEKSLLLGNPALRLFGMDEAGRGPIAGPLAVGLFGYTLKMDGLRGVDDSKKLSPKARLTTYLELVSLRSPWAVGFAHPLEIDSLGMTKAFRLASKRAFEALEEPKESGLIVLVDGNLNPKLPVPTLLMPNGDAYSGTIAAASIVAKVTRDTLMEKLDQKYPAYGFAVHKGYPTPEHILRVETFGPCPEHRVSFMPLKGYERQAS